MESLKERIFKVIEKQIDIKDFERWLYSEKNLSDRMDEGLILELYSFNYNQKGVNYEFRKLFLQFFDEKEFTSWKIIANLKTLEEGCNVPERILADFYDLGYEDHPYLTSIGHTRDGLEDCEYYGWSRERMISEIQKEASQLLLEIQEWLQTAPNFDLSQFEPKTKKTDIIPYSVPTDFTATERGSKKWWEFWK